MPKSFYNHKKNYQGFTLIELLVVILVIATLSGLLLGVVNSEGVRSKARDSQRKADLNKIRLALEAYFADNRAYSRSNNGSGWGTWEQIGAGSQMIDNNLQPNYINPLPMDPTKSTTLNLNPCSGETNHRYLYRSSADGSTYELVAIMEVTSSHEDSPCSLGCTGGTENFCYVVKNP